MSSRLVSLLSSCLLFPVVAVGSPLCDAGRTTGIPYTVSDAPGAPTNPFFLYCPPGFDTATGRFPVVVLVHGGSFTGGSPADWFQPFVDSETGEPRESVAKRIADLGFVVASPGYRFAEPGVPYQNGTADVARFVDVLFRIESVQATFKVDPSRVTIFGTSAGGYLSMWEATRGAHNYACAGAVAAPLYLPFSTGPNGKPIERETVKVFGDGGVTPSNAELNALSPMARAYQLRKVGKVHLVHEQNDSAVTVTHTIGFAPFADLVFGIPQSKFDDGEGRPRAWIGTKPAPPAGVASHLVDGDEAGVQRLLSFLQRNCR